MSYQYAKAEGNTLLLIARHSTKPYREIVWWKKECATRIEAIREATRWNNQETRRLNGEAEPYDSILSPEL